MQLGKLHIGIAALAAALVLIGTSFGMSVPINYTLSLPASLKGAPVYPVTLVEVMAAPWNATYLQPSYYEVTSNGLVQPSRISLPANTLIELTIVSYDTPGSRTPAQYANVTGVIGDKMLVINGTYATGTMSSLSMSMMPFGEWVSSVPLGSIAHTFTIPDYGVNIPVIGGDTEIAYLYLNKTGTTQWQCMVPCGDDSVNGGWSDAMVTSGWMTGIVNVYTPPSQVSNATQQSGATPQGVQAAQSAPPAESSSTTVLLGIIAALIVIFTLFFVYRK